jgi:glucose-6-phosphate-specific signal transduction histidine kinase
MVRKRKDEREFPFHIQIGLNIFEFAELCRQENNALRSILRKLGLSDRAIQSRVRRLLKKPELDETGAQALRRVSEESLKRCLDADAQAVLAKIDLKGRRVQ